MNTSIAGNKGNKLYRTHRLTDCLYIQEQVKVDKETPETQYSHSLKQRAVASMLSGCCLSFRLKSSSSIMQMKASSSCSVYFWCRYKRWGRTRRGFNTQQCGGLGVNTPTTNCRSRCSWLSPSRYTMTLTLHRHEHRTNLKLLLVVSCWAEGTAVLWRN